MGLVKDEQETLFDHPRVRDYNVLRRVGKLLRFVQDLAHHHCGVVFHTAFVRAFCVVRRAWWSGYGGVGWGGLGRPHPDGPRASYLPRFFLFLDLR